MTNTKTRHHENQLVHDAVEKYAEAINARSDMSDARKQEAIEAYTERMRELWDNPTRGTKARA